MKDDLTTNHNLNKQLSKLDKFAEGKREYTKDNPGCYHSAIKYLAGIENTSAYKTLVFDSSDKLYRQTKSSNPKKKFKLNFYSHQIKVIDKDGVSHNYIENHLRYNFRGIEAARFEVEVLKNFEDFKTPINKAGNYKDSLGGGWHSNCQLYEINGSYFAMMECSC
jgi:hypothetical protein